MQVLRQLLRAVVGERVGQMQFHQIDKVAEDAWVVVIHDQLVPEAADAQIVVVQDQSLDVGHVVVGLASDLADVIVGHVHWKRRVQWLYYYYGSSRNSMLFYIYLF